MPLGTNQQLRPGDAGQNMASFSLLSSLPDCGCPIVSPEQSGAMTVISQVMGQYTTPVDATADVGDWSDAYLVARFGVNNTNMSVELDIGCEASFPALSVSIVGYYPKISDLSQPMIEVATSMGRWKSHSLPPTRTLRVSQYLVDSDTTPWLKLPPFAADCVEVRLDGDAAVPVNFFIEYSRNGSSSGLMKNATLNPAAYDPVPRGARYFRITNLNKLNGQYGAVQFRLQL